VKNQCTAKSKSSQVRCRNAAINDHHVCRMHGGSSPATKAKAAERRVIREAAELAASRRDTSKDAAWVDPREVLLSTVTELHTMAQATGEPIFKSQLLKQAGTLSKMAIDARIELESAARRAYPDLEKDIAANDEAWLHAIDKALIYQPIETRRHPASRQLDNRLPACGDYPRGLAEL
jgi:hypothetical protein